MQITVTAITITLLGTQDFLPEAFPIKPSDFS
jgi:hypothetical protein